MVKLVIAAQGLSNAGGVQDLTQRKISFYVSHEKAKQAIQVLHGFFIDKNPKIVSTVENYILGKITQFKTETK